MGFFKDFKSDLSKAVNELSDDAVKFVAPQAATEEEPSVSEVPADEKLPDEAVTDEVLTNEVIPEEIQDTDDSEVLSDDSEVLTDDSEENTVEEENVESVSEIPEESEREAMFDYNDKSELYSDETAIITPGLKITGDINSEGSIELLGTVEGNVECKGRLIVSGKIIGNSSSSDFLAEKADVRGDINCSGAAKIGAGSVIIGNLTATSAVIAGAVKGDIDVHGPVIVDSSAIVMGNIKSKLVQINNGAVLEGYCSQCYSDNNPKKFFEDK